MACGAAGLVLRLFPPDVYAIYPACPVRALTGWYCPGCGATHALAALLSGQFGDAVRQNGLVVALLPVLAVIACVQGYSAVRYNRWSELAIPRAVAAAGVAVSLIFAVVRNWQL